MPKQVAAADPRQAASILENALRGTPGWKGDLTIPDAAEKGGLALRDASTGLHELVSRYDGHLAASSKGELLFRFPAGLVARKPERPLRRLLRKIGRGLAGLGRMAVRAWVSVVVIAYALVFGAILIALASRSDDDSGPGEIVSVVLRLVFEALYWTFHPFSPFYMQREPGWMLRQSGRRRRSKNRIPFYERVNRFVFGPEEPRPDPRATQSRMLAEIRHQKGRIGLGDVMRVTGLARGEADAFISRLLLDFDGEVEVTDEGAIIHVFKDIRQTALDAQASPERPAAYFSDKAQLLPITGNEPGSNLLFAALNGFNLAASGYALAHGLTIERLFFDLQHMSRHAEDAFLGGDLAPPTGAPLVLGWVPFVFSAGLFALPLVRWLRRPAKARAIEAENGRRAIAERVLDRHPGQERLPHGEAAEAFRLGAGRAGTDDELLQAARSLGGDLDLDEAAGVTYFRFPDLAAEQKALESERQRAPLSERGVGNLVFSSDS